LLKDAAADDSLPKVVIKFLHSDKVVDVLQAPSKVYSPLYITLLNANALAFATEATCIKNLAWAIGHVGSGEAVVAAGHVAESVVVFDCKQISWAKNAPASVASAATTLFNFKVVANLGTTTTLYTVCLSPEVIEVAWPDISVCKPTV